MSQKMPTRRDLGDGPDAALKALAALLQPSHDAEYVMLGAMPVVLAKFANGYKLAIGGLHTQPEYSVFGPDGEDLVEYDGHRPHEDAFPLRWTHATAANMLEWAAIRCDRVSRL